MLACLTEAELQALRLLAEGHTAKSIASVTGTSVGAINERLRHARRKTGAGSSRELARMVRSEKVGDQKIGMAAADGRDDALAHGRPRTARRWTKGVIAMSVILIGGAVTLILTGIVEPAPQSEAVVDGMVIPSVKDHPEQLYLQLRSEGRDAAWAPKMEAALKERYDRVPHVGGPSNSLKVTCGSTLCEVVGSIALPKPKTEAEYEKANVVLNALQGNPLYADIEAFGLERPSGTFGSRRDDPDRAVFLTYWHRK